MAQNDRANRARRGAKNGATDSKGPDPHVPGDVEKKIQVTFDSVSGKTVDQKSRYFQVSKAEVIRSAWRVYVWSCQQVRAGYDVGAYDRSTGRFVAVDIPYATEVDLPNMTVAKTQV